MFTLNLMGKNKTFNEAISLKEIANEYNEKYYAAKVNNRLRELNYIIDYDANVEFLDLKNSDTSNIYESTLRYILVMALKRIDLKLDVKFNYNVSRSIKCIFNNKVDINELKKKMDEIINQKLDIIRVNMTKKKAIEYYEKMNYIDKIEVLKYRKRNRVNMYKCAEYYNYLYGYMLPNTSYIDSYNLIEANGIVVLQYPRSELNGLIPEYDVELTYQKTLDEENEWLKKIDGMYISRINNKIENKKAYELISMCESRHSNQLYDLAIEIKKHKNIKMIAISGPSSSGKTTFANKLLIELKLMGYDPVLISIDDFYLNVDQIPFDENGKFDFEHIEALDLKLFNESMYNLINGKEILLPKFDFKTRMRSFDKKISLKKNSIVVIEGIHALNERLTNLIPRNEKFKIFISPQIQLNTDNHNPISISQLRLIRRMVRDYKFRNTKAIETIAMWDSVRRGEFKWVYPFQEDVDFVYNSELTYELFVLKKIALKLLNEIDEDSYYYIKANRLMKFLRYLKEIDEIYVPNTSLLREFIGGSIFYEDI